MSDYRLYTFSDLWNLLRLALWSNLVNSSVSTKGMYTVIRCSFFLYKSIRSSLLKCYISLFFFIYMFYQLDRIITCSFTIIVSLVFLLFCSSLSLYYLVYTNLELIYLSGRLTFNSLRNVLFTFSHAFCLKVTFAWYYSYASFLLAIFA